MCPYNINKDIDMIDPEKYRKSKKYDIYFDVKTRVPYKRCNRNRKTEIQESELVPLKLRRLYNNYIVFSISIGGRAYCIGIYCAFADAFPELVGHQAEHDFDPETYSELNHKSGIHDTWESNFPENLEWTSPRVNRAMTCRTRSLSDMDEKERNSVIKKRDKTRERRMDPEYRERERAADRERKRKYREENKLLRQQQTAELNEMLARVAAKTKKN